MKNLFCMILIFVSFSLSNCSTTDDDSSRVITNQIALLKVDYETSTFEGGNILSFPSSPTYGIETSYQAPGDFGGVQIKYAGLNQIIFDGTIYWAALGERSYPQEIYPASTFAISATTTILPNASLMENVDYDEFAYYPDVVDFTGLWSAIHRLEIVEQYRANNPNAKFYFFLYTPSVGVGNPADWNWYILIKN